MVEKGVKTMKRLITALMIVAVVGASTPLVRSAQPPERERILRKIQMKEVVSPESHEGMERLQNEAAELLKNGQIEEAAELLEKIKDLKQELAKAERGEDEVREIPLRELREMADRERQERERRKVVPRPDTTRETLEKWMRQMKELGEKVDDVVGESKQEAVERLEREMDRLHQAREKYEHAMHLAREAGREEAAERIENVMEMLQPRIHRLRELIDGRREGEVRSEMGRQRQHMEELRHALAEKKEAIARELDEARERGREEAVAELEEALERIEVEIHRVEEKMEALERGREVDHPEPPFRERLHHEMAEIEAAMQEVEEQAMDAREEGRMETLNELRKKMEYLAKKKRKLRLLLERGSGRPVPELHRPARFVERPSAPPVEMVEELIGAMHALREELGGVREELGEIREILQEGELEFEYEDDDEEEQAEREHEGDRERDVEEGEREHPEEAIRDREHAEGHEHDHAEHEGDRERDVEEGEREHPEEAIRDREHEEEAGDDREED
jgi:exonuclease VII small subunit